MISGKDPFVGTTLGSYKVTEPIGEGGMARIYKGFHIELNRYAAIKVINWGLQEDPEFTERFRREAQAIATLRHPNIVQIFDFGKHASGYFMVMEFIDGSDLSVQLGRTKEERVFLPKEKVIKTVKDIAAALDYAHSHGVIHRDVKPSNVMIHKEGQAILTDFGLVMLPAHKSQATLGNTFGTPHYVAPEQAISSAAAVTASDIYSLGVILYEMAANQLPFDDESPFSVALKHISSLPVPPSTFNADLPAGVEEVILKALAKQPSDRFASAGELVVSLEEAWSGAALTSSKSSQRKPRPVLPTGVPPAADVANITLPTAAAIAPAAALARPAEEKSIPARKRPVLLVWGPWAVAIVIVAVLLFSPFFFFNNSAAQPTVVASPEATDLALAGDPTQTPTSTLSPTPWPTFTPTLPPPTSTPMPLPTATSSPTDTPSPEPTQTPTLAPTSTSTPTATSTPVPAPAAPPTPRVLTVAQLKGKILFKTDRSGTVDIYQMEADGSNQRPIPRDSWSIYTQLEANLSFSPNGAERVVTRGEGQLDLWRVNFVTGQELRVTSTQEAEYDAAWSPVDNRLAYVSEVTGRGDIYMLNLDGSAVTRLTDNVDDFDKHPTWSPDGMKIAFWSNMGFNKTRQIWVIDLATKTLTSLSDNPFNDWDPVWVW